MTAADTVAPATPLNDAPLRTAIEISTNLVAHALKSFKNYNATTGAIVTAAQGGLANLEWAETYYQPLATKLNQQLFTVDEKLAPIVHKAQAQQAVLAAALAARQAQVVTYTKDVVADTKTRVTPLVEKARAEQKRLTSYTTEVVQNANQTARATFETNLVKTQEALRKLLATMRLYEAELEARIPYSAELRARISALIEAAVTLSQQSRAYITASVEPTRNALHQRLEFFATELESRLVKGEVTQVEGVQNLVDRVKGLLAAATEAAAQVTVQGVRTVSTFVATKNSEQVAKQAADTQDAKSNKAPAASTKSPAAKATTLKAPASANTVSKSPKGGSKKNKR